MRPAPWRDRVALWATRDALGLDGAAALGAAAFVILQIWDFDPGDVGALAGGALLLVVASAVRPTLRRLSSRKARAGPAERWFPRARVADRRGSR
jgi:hypothetical protein